MIDGIYAMYYTGSVGTGHGLLVLSAGQITGADATGGLYEGEYNESPEGRVTGKVILSASPGTQLVTGAAAGHEGLNITVPIDLPANFANGQALRLKTPTGPVNAIFRKLRDGI